MKNVTLSISDELVEQGRRYAQEHHTTLNALVRDLLSRAVREERTDWVGECLTKMDAAKGRSGGRKWKREDLYDV